MKTIIRSLVLIALVFLSNGKVFAQQLTIDQEEQFRRKVKQLIDSYSEANQITSDYATQDPKLIEKLRSSFVVTSKKQVFNDLLPPKIEGSKYLTPLEYAQYAQRFYPEGLDVKVEIQDITINPKSYKKGGYYEAIVKAKKIIKGFYGNMRIHSFSDVLHFYVSGIMVDGNVDGLGITRVAESKKNSKVQANRRFSGLYFGVSGGYSYSAMYSSQFAFNPSSLSLTSKGWYTQPFDPNVMNIIPALELHLMASKGFGIGTGIKIGKYNPGFNIDRLTSEVSTTFRDIDGHDYSPIYDISDLQMVRHIETYDIPMLLKFRTGTKAVGLYLDMGVMYTIYKSMEMTVDGTVTRKAKYPNFGNVILEADPSIPQLGEIYDLYTNKTFSSTANSYQLPLPSNGLSGIVSLGFSIAPVKNIMVRLGVTANVGIQNDISYDPTDSSIGIPKIDYYYTTGQQLGATLLNSVSADFGIYYRVFK